MNMEQFPRIRLDPDVMDGKACIRGLRVIVATVVGLLASGRSVDEILVAYPYLERADIDQSLAYYRRLAGQGRSLVEALSMPGLGDVDFDPQRVCLEVPLVTLWKSTREEQKLYEESS